MVLCSILELQISGLFGDVAGEKSSSVMKGTYSDFLMHMNDIRERNDVKIIVMA